MQARNLQIFDQLPEVSRPAKKSAATLTSVPAAAVSEPRRVALDSCGGDLDQRILVILMSGVEVGETVELAFRRKEHQLGELFATLSIAASRDLQKRLANPRSGDRVAELFGRMTVERRGRLIAFLADARRREACRR
jgi:hypothetical protein